MTIEGALPYLREHQQELINRIHRGKYTPSPVRRIEIPKTDGGVRKSGIPTVTDRTLQQAITQKSVLIYELLFADGSYGYRPNRSAKDAILKVKEYAEQGYTYAAVLDLSKYFDTLNHGILRNFKFPGFALGRNGSGIYVRVHPKSWKKFMSKLKILSSRRRVQSIKSSLERIKVYARGWLNYYGIASMKNNIDDINGWLCHRIRMCIWKQWKKPGTKVRNLMKMGAPKDLAWQAGNSCRKYGNDKRKTDKQRLL